MAVATGVLMVGFVTVARGLMVGMHVADDWGLILRQFIVIIAPFGLLALAGVTKVAPWIVGITLTAALWGYYLYDFSLARGVNFLLGPVMLLSPIWISIACFAAAKGFGKRT